MNLIFRALNDDIRRRILRLLRNRNMTPGEIAGRFSFAKPMLSHHRDLLRQPNQVVSLKGGQLVFYSLNTTVVDEIIRWMMHLNARPKSWRP